MLFVYFPISGRGELARLVAKVGGIEDFNEATELPEGITKAECGSAGSVPLLIDGDLKMNESTAIEIYLASIAPKFAGLTPKQRAKDVQFCCLKETCLGALAKPLFGGKDKDGIQAAADKFLPIIQGILPDSGFVNGLDLPTVADFAIVNICLAYLPFGASFKHGEVDFATKFPKLVAHAERTTAVEEVGRAVSESATMNAAAFGF
jgi:glutathione S-transferase